MAVNTVAAPQQGTNVNDKLHLRILILRLIKDMLIKILVKLNFGQLCTIARCFNLKANYTIDDSVKERRYIYFKYINIP